MTMSTIDPGIKTTNEAFVAAVARGDAAGMAAVYGDEGEVLPPGGEAVRGRPGIEAFWRGVLDGLGLKAVRLETLELEVFGETAYEVGRGTLLGADGAVLDEVKYIVIWKRVGGTWLWHRDIFNSRQGG